MMKSRRTRDLRSLRACASSAWRVPTRKDTRDAVLGPREPCCPCDMAAPKCTLQCSAACIPAELEVEKASRAVTPLRGGGCLGRPAERLSPERTDLAQREEF